MKIVRIQYTVVFANPANPVKLTKKFSRYAVPPIDGQAGHDFINFKKLRSSILNRLNVSVISGGSGDSDPGVYGLYFIWRLLFCVTFKNFFIET